MEYDFFIEKRGFWEVSVFLYIVEYSKVWIVGLIKFYIVENVVFNFYVFVYLVFLENMDFRGVNI